MAPHLTPTEQDRILAARVSRKTSAHIYDVIARQRLKRGERMVHINVIRCFLRGRTHGRSKVETRGRKRSLSRRNVLTMDAARRKIINDSKGAHQVTWQDIIAKGRAPRAHATTVARAFAREGMQVKLRRSREKPQRTPAMERERMEVCGRMRRWPLARFTEAIDMIIDNKAWEVPTTPEARLHLAKQKVVAQLRTPAEGLHTHFTKPNAKLHRKNLGGRLTVCAGISNCRIVLWEYIGRWNGQAAADLYKGPIMKTLVSKRGRKASYLIAEDNDPTGYKSGKGNAEKRRQGIKTIEWPRYSPDLMPLDFSLWKDIDTRVAASAPDGTETVAEFKRRLRRLALRTPASVVRAAVEAMRTRASAIWEAKGKDIARD